MFFPYNIFEYLVPIMFTLTICVFIFGLIKGILRYFKNEKSPIVGTKAELIEKMEHMHTHNDNNGVMHTRYTRILKFKLDTGSIMEFIVNKNEFERVPQYKGGTLTFQGTRFLKFEVNTNE